MLLREIDHRAKNSFQLAINLLRMQASRSASAEAREELTSAAARLGTVCHSHARLYQSADLKTLPVHVLLSDICSSLIDGHDTISGVRLRLDLEAVEAEASFANTLGIIASEAVVNALKYAFAGRSSGLIEVRLRRLAQGMLRLSVSDDGVGATAGEKGLGLELIERLAGRYDGNAIVMPSALGGFEVVVTLDPGVDAP